MVQVTAVCFECCKGCTPEWWCRIAACFQLSLPLCQVWEHPSLVAAIGVWSLSPPYSGTSSYVYSTLLRLFAHLTTQVRSSGKGGIAAQLWGC